MSLPLALWTGFNVATNVAAVASLMKNDKKDQEDKMAIEIAGLATRGPAPPARRAAPLRVQKRPDGTYIAEATLPNGARIMVAVPGRALERWIQVGGDCPTEVSGLFDDIARGVASVAHSEAVQNLAAGALSLYGVPPGVTRKALDLSGDLLDKAARGHGRARARVEQIRTQAAAGEPRAVRAQAAIVVRERSNRHARAAMTLLYRAQTGDQRAGQRVREIEAAAGRGEGRARRAMAAMQAVVTATRQASQPGPPAGRAAPPPPARAARPPRVVSVRPGPGGRQHVTLEVGGTQWNWLKSQLGWHRGYRPEAETFGLRDAYNLGLQR